MAIIVVLTLLVPALISVLFYERLKGYQLIWHKRVELLLVFAFLINLVGYGVLWARGWEFISWSLSLDSSARMISVVVQYMVISLVAGISLAYVLSLVRVSKSSEETLKRDTEDNALDSPVEDDGASSHKSVSDKSDESADDINAESK